MANTSLTRTSSASATKGTLSMWVKKSKLGVTQYLHHNVTSTSSNYGLIFFDTNDQIEMMMTTSGSHTIKRVTTRKFTDPSAWYHFVFVTDVTNSTAQNRMRIYVNGVEETSFSTNDSPSGATNRFYEASASNDHVIGANSSNASNFDGSMSHVYNIVDTVYTPSAFGSTDSTTGEWEINTSPSVTFGSQGYLILKDGNTITDQSLNSNDFSLASGTLTKTEDCPSNVFPIFAGIYCPKSSTNAGAFLNGGTTVGGSPSDASSIASMGARSGKYYWEIKVQNATNTRSCGVVRSDSIDTSNSSGIYPGGNGNATIWTVAYHMVSGYVQKNQNGTQSQQGSLATLTTGDILGVALNLTDYEIKWYKNNSLITTTSLSASWVADGNFLLPCNRMDGSQFVQYNFGNGYFGTTAVTTNSGNGYAGAEGASIFNYDPPNLYSALNTKGLNL